MARIKSKVTIAQEGNLPGAGPAQAQAAANSSMEMASASGSASPSSTTSTCPHCSSSFPEMASKDFRDHVSACTGPSTAAEEISSDSSLTPPPDSPSVHAAKKAKAVDESDAAQVNSGAVNGSLANVVNASDHDLEIDQDDSQPSPYIKDAVEYYDKIDEREGSVVTRRNSEEPEEPKTPTPTNREGSADEKPDPKTRHAFQKFTPFEDFGDYLMNAEEMSYEELYDRTSHVNSALVTYQKEWDDIEKEIYIHESYVKAQAKKTAEISKAVEEGKAKIEDQIYLDYAQRYRAELKLSRVDWEQYLDGFGDDPKSVETVERLRSLRLPNFLSSIHKRQKAREQEPSKLVDRPMMAERITKEELALDKRKRGRLIDQITFEDMKHADVYGFNYSSQPHHVGNQPQPTYNGKSKTKGDASDEGRSRSQRSKAQKSYDPDKSVSPETENEELPAKRTRKPRMNLDMGAETQQRGRNAHSRGATPPVRTFPSGKRVGRPPTKSKLKDFEVPPESTDAALENGTGPRKLAPKQEEQLHDAALSLASKQRELVVNHTQVYFTGNIGEAVYGGNGQTSRPSSSSSAEGGKKRKRESTDTGNNPRVHDYGQMTPILPSTSVPQSGTATPAPGPAPKSRKRKAKDTEIDVSLLNPVELEAYEKKKAKSAKLSSSLKSRWERGEMAGAMETRKATNAAKKAAKAAMTTGMVSPPEPPAIVPPTSFNHTATAKFIQPPQTIAPAASQPQQPAAPALPAPKRKQSVQKSKSSPLSSPKGITKAKKKAVLPPAINARNVGGRARKPNRLRMSMDGTDEVEGGEMRQQYKSEYDQYQALASPHSQVVLGKRVRKPRLDVRGAEASGDDLEDEEYDE
ncbi:hypothetical protein HYALB_00008069 [Hymenoscyphus albidus]|uniref:Uncharacterized protein n=1 Tax=Hymenoscyphus albidus TaxID=595503 RepID=A0A9N9Q0R7_9HELO|nr:hypothetical protein HYALB_00008069 [Hymenoscyphus albidus]